MVNNLRDLEDDAAHGKRTLMVRIGSGKGKCWCMRALGWAAGLTVVFAMPLSVYAKLLDLLIKLPAEVDRDRSCTEYGICGDWSWGKRRLDEPCGVRIHRRVCGDCYSCRRGRPA